MRPSDPVEDRVRRYETIRAAADAGKSLRAIGREFGISPERVRQILAAGTPGLAGWPGHSARNTEVAVPLDTAAHRRGESV